MSISEDKIKKLFLTGIVCLFLVSCNNKEKTQKSINEAVDSTVVKDKIDPVEEINKHLEAVLQYYHSINKPQTTPTRACYDATSKIYFLKFPVDDRYSYKDDDGNSQETVYHYAGWNAIYEENLTFVTIGNGSMTLTNAPDTSQNISVNLDGLPCMNFSQLMKVWDNQ